MQVSNSNSSSSALNCSDLVQSDEKTNVENDKNVQSKYYETYERKRLAKVKNDGYENLL